MLSLLLHADKPPEFLDDVLGARVVFPEPSPDDSGNLTYESIGKIVTHVSPEGDEPVVVAQCRAFAHPDVLAEIRKRGDIRVLPPEPTDVY